MANWKIYKLCEVANLSTGFPFDGHKYTKEGQRVVRGDNITIGTLRWDADKDKRWNETFARAKEFSLQAGDIVIGMDGSRVGRNRAQIKESDLPLLLAQRVACIRHNSQTIQKFLYYQIFSNRFEDYIKSVHTGTSIPHVSLKQIGDFCFQVPDLFIQQRIANILSTLDDKIELNRRINENLEQQAQALFDFHFIQHPEKLGSYERGSLIDIANYINGLAMQKFRPQIEEKGIPVLKIKELGQGRTDSSSDICSENISKEYIINDGDVIFSWSGTLMVNIWCGGLCGLNQHLFKVTSDKYPKWFYYFWTKYHLGKFIRIAKDKAVTMGHIKRGDLEKSEVLIPEIETLSKLDEIISPILNQIIGIKCENRNLENLRDTLLPKLMSGEIKLSEIETKLDE